MKMVGDDQRPRLARLQKRAFFMYSWTSVLN